MNDYRMLLLVLHSCIPNAQSGLLEVNTVLRDVLMAHLALPSRCQQRCKAVQAIAAIGTASNWFAPAALNAADTTASSRHLTPCLPRATRRDGLPLLCSLAHKAGDQGLVAAAGYLCRLIATSWLCGSATWAAGKAAQ